VNCFADAAQLQPDESLHKSVSSLQESTSHIMPAQNSTKTNTSMQNNHTQEQYIILL